MKKIHLLPSRAFSKTTSFHELMKPHKLEFKPFGTCANLALDYIFQHRHYGASWQDNTSREMPTFEKNIFPIVHKYLIPLISFSYNSKVDWINRQIIANSIK